MRDDRLRLDKWLWYARFLKTRTLASSVCADGRLRINGVPVMRANHAVKPGDVLTFAQSDRIRIIRVVALGARRGPAAEARLLYEDLAPAEMLQRKPVNPPTDVSEDTPTGV